MKKIIENQIFLKKNKLKTAAIENAKKTGDEIPECFCVYNKNNKNSFKKIIYNDIKETVLLISVITLGIFWAYSTITLNEPLYITLPLIIVVIPAIWTLANSLRRLNEKWDNEIRFTGFGKNAVYLSKSDETIKRLNYREISHIEKNKENDGSITYTLYGNYNKFLSNIELEENQNSFEEEILKNHKHINFENN